MTNEITPDETDEKSELRQWHEAQIEKALDGLWRARIAAEKRAYETRTYLVLEVDGRPVRVKPRPPGEWCEEERPKNAAVPRSRRPS